MFEIRKHCAGCCSPLDNKESPKKQPQNEFDNKLDNVVPESSEDSVSTVIDGRRNKRLSRSNNISPLQALYVFLLFLGICSCVTISPKTKTMSMRNIQGIITQPIAVGSFNYDDTPFTQGPCTGSVVSQSAFTTDNGQVYRYNFIEFLGQSGSSLCMSNFGQGINETFELSVSQSRFVHEWDVPEFCADPTNTYSCKKDSSGNNAESCGTCHCPWSPSDWTIDDCDPTLPFGNFSHESFFTDPKNLFIPDTDPSAPIPETEFCHKNMRSGIANGCFIDSLTDYQVKIYPKFTARYLMKLKRGNIHQLAFIARCCLNGNCKEKRVSLPEMKTLILTDICSTFESIELTDEDTVESYPFDFSFFSLTNVFTNPDNIYWVKNSEVSNPNDYDVNKFCFARYTGPTSINTDFADLNSKLQFMTALKECHPFTPIVALSLPSLITQTVTSRKLSNHLQLTNVYLDLPDNKIYVNSPVKGSFRIKSDPNYVYQFAKSHCILSGGSISCNVAYNNDDFICTVTVESNAACENSLYDSNSDLVYGTFNFVPGVNHLEIRVSQSVLRNDFVNVCYRSSNETASVCFTRHIDKQTQEPIIEGPNTTTDPTSDQHEDVKRWGSYEPIWIIVTVIGSVILVAIVLSVVYKLYCMMVKKKSVVYKEVKKPIPNSDFDF